ncbi:outer membrane beta-barrel protein [Pedobacter deserti]|uniref:outer membrane beta-barrel protein n=1 Tax=Pedobacter deserti TaxID=2817382 RepID=UPI002108D3B5|nr:outer membrane beta-barrel protein [Pedobacter sp. SYSU D00382]
MRKKLIVFFFLAFTILSVSAQHADITGLVRDSLNRRNLQNCSVLLLRHGDSVITKSTATDINGRFVLKGISKGNYQLAITHISMGNFSLNLELSDTSRINLGHIYLDPKAKILNEVVIRATKRAIRLKGDTIIFQADSFAVRRNSNVQLLLQKLPGMSVNKNGTISAQGKTVRSVLVDGEEFFGDDPQLATKYLKADAVEEIEVYDRKSKQAELTGIDDGIRNRTVNIKLKENSKNGYLSSVDLNHGTNDFQDYGGMAGVFGERTKAAAFGTYTNLINESRIYTSMRKLKGEDYDVIEVGDDGSSVMYAYGMDDDEDYTQPSGGLPNNLNVGGYFSQRIKDRMGMKVSLKAFDYGNKDLRTTLTQELLPGGAQFTSLSRDDDRSKSAGKSVRGNYTYKLDAGSTLKVAFGAQQSRNFTEADRLDYTKNEKNDVFISQNNQSRVESGENATTNGNINWFKRFQKKGRTLSIDIQPERQVSSAAGTSVNRTYYFDDQGGMNRFEDVILNKDNTNKRLSLGTRFNYTEPLTEQWTLEAGYSFKTISSTSYRLIRNNRNLKVDSLSNNFKFVNFSNVGKMTMQYKFENFSISGGLQATQTTFELKDLDVRNEFDRDYLNLAPSTNIFYKLDDNSTVSVNYNGYMQQPGIEQIQPVKQLDNPLYQIVGNTNLKPSFTNTFGVSYNTYSPRSDLFVSAYLNYGFTRNAITDTELVDDFNKRILSFTNLNGINSTSGNIYFSRNFSKINLRLGLDLGFNTANAITVINFTTNKTRNNRYNLRTHINYNTPRLDLSYSPSANFMYGKSSIGGLNDGKSLSHEHEFSGSVQLPYRMEFNTTLSLNFRPSNASFDRALNVAILNSYLAAKLLRNESLEVRITATDLLNQKIGYSRYVGGNVISENTFSYIPRYALLGVNWNFSGNFRRSAPGR